VSYSAQILATYFLKIILNVWFNLSIVPSHWGWWAMVFNFLIPRSLQTSSIRIDNKLVPLSDNKASGTPNSGTSSSTNKQAILKAFWSGMGNAIGHFVKRSWKTMRYLLPLVVSGSSIISTPIFWNGWSTGIVTKSGIHFCFDPPLGASPYIVHQVSEHMLPPPPSRDHLKQFGAWKMSC